jgi:transposase
VQAATLSYKLKLFPTANKADTLALLTGLFARHHAACTTALREESRCPSTKGMGEFAGRAYRRAFNDWRRTRKAGHMPGALKAELIDAAQVQQPRNAIAFDLWIMVQGVGKLYVPARKHRAINRALAYPSATLCEQGEVFRKNAKWYCRVAVRVPLPEVTPARTFVGVDVGVRASVVRSDGYRGPDLRPILKRQRNRRAMDQRRGIERRVETSPQRQLLAREARRTVLVALKSGRGVAVEDPCRLIRWKAHAARYFGTRVALLASLMGVPANVVNPAHTSTTCPECGFVERRQRHKGTFRCWRCGYTHNADFAASRNVCHRATYVSCTSRNGSLSPCSGGGIVE